MTTSDLRAQRPRRFARCLAMLRERWWVVVLVTVLGGAIAFGVSQLLEPQYRATAQVVYSARDAQLASQALSASGTAGLVHNVAGDALALQTTAFSERVGRVAGVAMSSDELRAAVSVAADPVTDLIEITATGSDPAEAATIANAFATEFIVMRQEDTQALLTEAEDLVQARIDTMTPAEAGSDYSLALQQQRDTLEMLQSMEITDYEILQEAEPPLTADSPRPFRNLLIGLGSGLLAGLLLALLLGHLDRRIKDPGTLEDVMDLPVLGAMPGAPRKSGRSSAGHPAVGFRRANDGLLES
ncbi:MAG: hypothetical protein JXA57_01260, partial [Armatimonadetes bacterium]|nr:hypothetical protein [Armatimonadota bacterium]